MTAGKPHPQEHCGHEYVTPILMATTLACIPVMFILLVSNVSNPDVPECMKAVSCGIVLTTGMLLIGMY